MSSSRSRRALLDNIFCQSSSQRSSSPFRLYSGRKDDSRFQKRCSATPHNGEVVGIKSLVPLWWSATAWSAPGWLRGLRGGLLDSGDSAGWLSDPLRPSTSSIQVASLCVLAYSCQPIEIVALIQELKILLRKGAVKQPLSLRAFTTVSSSSRRFRGRGTPSLTFHPERLYNLVSSTWRLHSQSFVPFPQAAGWSLWLYRKPSCRTLSSRFASLSSLRGERNIPVRSLLLRSHTLTTSLNEDYGSRFRHPPMYGQLTHPGLFRTRH